MEFIERDNPQPPIELTESDFSFSDILITAFDIGCLILIINALSQY